MASPTQWRWVWVNSRSWWWTGRPGVLRFMGSQSVRSDWETELNWTDIDWMQVLVCYHGFPVCYFYINNIISVFPQNSSSKSSQSVLSKRSSLCSSAMVSPLLIPSFLTKHAVVCVFNSTLLIQPGRSEKVQDTQSWPLREQSWGILIFNREQEAFARDCWLGG